MDEETEFKRTKARMAWAGLAMAATFPVAIYFVPGAKDIATLYFDLVKTVVVGFLGV